MGKVEKVFILSLCILIDIYKKAVSPLIGSRCRFYPSCSSYFRQSLKLRGVIKGSLYGVKRIFRCNPFNPGGYDPVEAGKI